jgi:hypothetical protein
MTSAPATGRVIGTAFIAACRARLASGLETIDHCLGQLTEVDLHWRPFESANSVCTIILHVCGNLRQWIVSAAGGAADVRDRPREFSDRTRCSVDEIRARVRETVNAADNVLARLDTAALASARRVQGFEETVLSAVLAAVAHFAGHVQEIVYVTRLRRGESYVFRWKPQTKEQGAPA